MSVVDDRLDAMIAMADATGLTLDEIVYCVGEVEESLFLELSERPSLLPRYIKSKVKP